MLSLMEELLTKRFIGDNMKDAYMKAVKWYSTNVLARDELRNITVSFEKDKQFPTITIHLYVSIVEEEVKQEHCNICKEFHHSFFINEVENCNNCSMSGYQRRIEQRLRIKKDAYIVLLKQRGLYNEN